MIAEGILLQLLRKAILHQVMDLEKALRKEGKAALWLCWPLDTFCLCGPLPPLKTYFKLHSFPYNCQKNII